MSIGAGGEQSIRYGHVPRKIVAIDQDAGALERFPGTRHREFATEQKFRDHAELLAKVKPQGEIAIRRVRLLYYLPIHTGVIDSFRAAYLSARSRACCGAAV